ncbi:MAG: DNA polymerase III subunit delta, partial [Ardenticatenia bacterium]|nr:DNA polymerase III subunit delta [Ardenticatenia bacterium]
MFYIFYGDNELARDEALASLLERVEDAGGCNIQRFDGRTVTFEALRHACDTPPFLSDRRIVIVRGLLERLKQGGKTFQEALLAYLPHLPATTRLFFIEGSRVDRRLGIWKLATRLAEVNPPRAFIREFAAPEPARLPAWIGRRARRHGGEITPQAARALAEAAGHCDLRLLDQELAKLVDYAGGHPITPEMVRLLVPYTRESNIFALLDAVARRDECRALRELDNVLRADAAPAYVLFMIVRQVRILLHVKDLSAQGITKRDIQARLRLHPYVVEKALRQVAGFSFS